MHTRTTFAALVALVSIAACDENEGNIFVTEWDVGVGGIGRRSVPGCTDENGYVDDDGPFAVGSEISTRYGVPRECIEYRGNAWFRECVAYSAPLRESLRSTNLDVLVLRADSGTFVGAGETTVIMEAGGRDVARRTFRAEPAASLATRLLAQPELVQDWAPDYAAVLESADGAAILRGGPGARFVVRAIAADGRELCGRPDLEITVSEGIEVLTDDEYWSGPTRLGEVFVLAATADAPERASIVLTSAGATSELALDVVDPSALTHLEVREDTLREGDTRRHIVDVSVHAGERRVHGASLAFETAGDRDCASVSIMGAGEHFTVSPRDTRFAADAYCGASAPPPVYRVSVAEARSIALELAVTP